MGSVLTRELHFQPKDTGIEIRATSKTRPDFAREVARISIHRRWTARRRGVGAVEFRSGLCGWFADPAIPSRRFSVRHGVLKRVSLILKISGILGKTRLQYGRVRKPPAKIREIRSETQVTNVPGALFAIMTLER